MLTMKFRQHDSNFRRKRAKVYYKMRQSFYYKMRQLLQNATFITNCDSTRCNAFVIGIYSDDNDNSDENCD